MSSIIGQRCYEALKNSQHWTTKTRISGQTIQGLTCPVCGNKSAWAYALDGDRAPMSINCNRKNSCGAQTSVVELFNIRVDIEQEYKPTNQDPHRPARVYLEGRGLHKVLQGLDFEYWPKVRKGTKSGAVLFPVVLPEGEGL